MATKQQKIKRVYRVDVYRVVASSSVVGTPESRRFERRPRPHQCHAPQRQMDVFCRCGGCGSCNDETANPMGGKCGNTPQRYTIKSPDVVRHGYRKYCKPCLRRMELARLATKHSLNLGLVLPGAKNNRCVCKGRRVSEIRVGGLGDSWLLGGAGQG
jgi:hypothetical protein